MRQVVFALLKEKKNEPVFFYQTCGAFYRDYELSGLSGQKQANENVNEREKKIQKQPE